MKFQVFGLFCLLGNVLALPVEQAQSSQQLQYRQENPLSDLLDGLVKGFNDKLKSLTQDVGENRDSEDREHFIQAMTLKLSELNETLATGASSLDLSEGEGFEEILDEGTSQADERRRLKLLAEMLHATSGLLLVENPVGGKINELLFNFQRNPNEGAGDLFHELQKGHDGAAAAAASGSDLPRLLGNILNSVGSIANSVPRDRV
ncbi:hypothetical protein C7999DRAFT_26988 [Corynascus novoguineensis]|uniref:Uncharacterized protein n=1 Tax=Corynascus novoguineensis TaxID=1126955 RepID=A0AAN7D253_9PEZI|nr:hypothetical protein C7999DRAFT_26988 [Corynascus novoguineensis]